MAVIDFSKTKVFAGKMCRNFEAVAIKSAGITGSATVALNFAVKEIPFAAMANGEAITATLTTGTATGIGFVWEGATDLEWNLTFTGDITGTATVETLYS